MQLRVQLSLQVFGFIGHVEIDDVELMIVLD